jgi:hypothetical protein
MQGEEGDEDEDRESLQHLPACGWHLFTLLSVCNATQKHTVSRSPSSKHPSQKKVAEGLQFFCETINACSIGGHTQCASRPGQARIPHSCIASAPGRRPHDEPPAALGHRHGHGGLPINPPFPQSRGQAAWLFSYSRCTTLVFCVEFQSVGENRILLLVALKTALHLD